MATLEIQLPFKIILRLRSWVYRCESGTVSSVEFYCSRETGEEESYLFLFYVVSCRDIAILLFFKIFLLQHDTSRASLLSNRLTFNSTRKNYRKMSSVTDWRHLTTKLSSNLNLYKLGYIKGLVSKLYLVSYIVYLVFNTSATVLTRICSFALRNKVNTTFFRLKQYYIIWKRLTFT